jgi:hypothetical protein
MEQTIDDVKFGRGFSLDKRDKNYLISNSSIYTSTPLATAGVRYWNDDEWWGNQGNTSECVGYAWTHWLEDGPILQPSSPQPIVNPTIIYTEAQKIDEWPGENYNGTSIRAGAKILQSQGFIQNYLWAYDLRTLVNTVLNIGPVVAGTHWYAGMFTPNSRTGMMSLKGRLAGGHAYIINGVDTKKQFFRIKNSWGKRWGIQGRALISFKDMQTLIRLRGEICLATEIPKTS